MEALGSFFTVEMGVAHLFAHNNVDGFQCWCHVLMFGFVFHFLC